MARPAGIAAEPNPAPLSRQVDRLPASADTQRIAIVYHRGDAADSRPEPLDMPGSTMLSVPPRSRLRSACVLAGLTFVALALGYVIPPLQAATPGEGEGQARSLPMAEPPVPRARPADAPLRAQTAQYLADGRRIVGERLAPDTARAIFTALDRHQWTEAEAAARQAGSPALAAYVDWFRYTRQNSGASFGQITAFIDRHPDWPWPNTLRSRAEAAIERDTPPQVLLAWFDRNPPASGMGMVHYGAALIDAGRVNDGALWIRRAWREGEFSTEDEARILRVHGNRLREGDHVARLDMLLWDRKTQAATRTMAHVNPGYQALARARIALYENAGNASALIEQVPPLLRRDPGLTYERLQWRKRRGLDDGVRQILDNPPEELGQPSRWWRLREREVRDTLDRGAAAEAYQLAAQHGQVDGASHADAQWLAGWIALRFLNEPVKAVGHFLPMFEKVSFPVSKARAAYWIGRSAEALGEDVRARQWFAEAAQHPTTYYGQLARIALGEVGAVPLPAAMQVPPQLERAFFDDPRVQVVLALSNAGQDSRAHPFVSRLMEDARSAEQYALVIQLSEMIGRSELSVRTAKAASQNGFVEVTGGYPVLQELVAANRDVESALVHAVSRQESEFRTDAVSPAGARGIMQLMPATAKEVAGSLRLSFEPERLTRDRAYNARLGAQYMQDLLRRWDNNYVLAIAAYNAGPSRVEQWIRRNGDPRTQQVDIIDWIERIPFAETRNYVQRVLEGLQVYRTLMGDGRLQLADDLRGR